MILAPHMLVGGAIGMRVKNVWLVFLLAFLSHFLLDFIPHWDYLDSVIVSGFPFFIKVTPDIIAGMLLLVIVVCRQNVSEKILRLIFLGAGAALLPDLIQFLFYNFEIAALAPFVDLHNFIHHFTGLSLAQGIPATILVSFLALLYMFRKRGVETYEDGIIKEEKI